MADALAQGRDDGGRPGGIGALVLLIGEHGGRINSDLMRIGLRLRNVGSEAFTWGDLHDFVTNMSLDSALARALNEGSVVWTLTDHLLATIADALHGANWQRGGGKGMRPKPIQRPGDKSSRSIGSDPIPISEFDNWWNGE